MASPGNRQCANSIGTLSFRVAMLVLTHTRSWRRWCSFRSTWSRTSRRRVVDSRTRKTWHTLPPTAQTTQSRVYRLWLVRQDRATINSGSPPSCGAPFWQWSVVSPSEIGWLASKVSRYLSILCLWSDILSYSRQCRSSDLSPQS